MNLHPKLSSHQFLSSIAVVLLLTLGGCSGFTPDDGPLRNDREEGPEKGVFTGSAGEFVILAPKSAADKEAVEEGIENEKSPQ